MSKIKKERRELDRELQREKIKLNEAEIEKKRYKEWYDELSKSVNEDNKRRAKEESEEGGELAKLREDLKLAKQNLEHEEANAASYK